MRVVLDTNVIVSAFLSPKGAPAQLVEQWRAEAIDVLVSQPILAEYQRALGYEKVRGRHGLSDEEIAEAVDEFRQYAILVEPRKRLVVVEADPDDDKFLDCAVAGGAAHIVSGAPHLCDLGEYAGIPILTPAVFLLALQQERGENSSP